MKRALFGIINVFPSVFIIFVLIIVFYIRTKFNADDMVPEEYRVYVILGLLLTFVSSITEVILMIVYINHSLTRNKYLTESSKVTWVVCLWVFNIVAIPIYWYKYVLKE